APATTAARASSGAASWLRTRRAGVRRQSKPHGRVQDRLAPSFGARERGGELAARKHQDAISELEQLLDFAADPDQRAAGLRERAHERIDLVLGAHVDAARRFVV